jgi:hypothetical protein
MPLPPWCEEGSPPAEAEHFDAARSRARRALARLAARADALGVWLADLRIHEVILDDERLRERTLEHGEEATTLTAALRRVAGEALAAARTTACRFRRGRARQIVEVCEALALLARPAALPRRPVLFLARPRLWAALLGAEARPSAIVIEGAVPPRRRSAIMLLSVPTIAIPSAPIVGPEERVLVDADAPRLVLGAAAADLRRVRASSGGRALEARRAQA